MGRHSLHSPFIYDLYQEILAESDIEKQKQIESTRNELINSDETIIIHSPGKKSTVGSGNKKPISEIAKKGISQKKYCELLYKIGVYTKAETIIELGTSFGIMSMYLASIPESIVYTLEGCENTLHIANNSFRKSKYKNIKTTPGNIDETLPELLLDIKTYDLVFIDANHTMESTLSYFELLLKSSKTNSVIVFDDIYWSAEMTQAWKKVKEDNRVSLTLDFYQMGVVFLDPDLQKENLILEL